MDAYVDTVAIAKKQNIWQTIEQQSKDQKLILKKEIAPVQDIEL